MRRSLPVVLLAPIIMSAVQWEVERIPNPTDANFGYPILALDEQGHARVLFTEEFSSLKLASNATGEWVITEVGQGTLGYYYSMDIDADGNVFVVYECVTREDDPDIFFACDTSGEFAPRNLTDDSGIQTSPIIRLDNDGTPYLMYTDVQDNEAELFFGEINPEGLKAEQVVDNLWPWYYNGYDLCFDNNNAAHIFYPGDNETYLWHAFSDENLANWTQEEIHSHESGTPTVFKDASGKLHVAYMDMFGARGRIHYLTNRSGTWTDELVSDNAPPEGGNERPSVYLDPEGNPHTVFLCSTEDWSYDVHYVCKSGETWAEEEVTSIPEKDEFPGFDRYFAIDAQGYAHLVYCTEDANFICQVYYAKSKEPVAVGIAEKPADIPLRNLEVRGSTVRFSLPESAYVCLSLYDASGRRVDHIASGYYPEGEHSIPVNSDLLSYGVYFVRAEIGDQAVSAKLIISL
ncbi:T9SS type A sorting domain-containing protein [candidate division WOR-3 bacterium]|nr:T9SS type A sorting domain-containing protein [candidate division WOR-3 bacterium]